MKLGLCVVGCGSFAKTFASSIQPLLPQINLYFASRDLAKAQVYSQMFDGAGAFGSYAEAAGDTRVEAMYLCTPHYLHPEHTALAASAGKHILLEKPIATTINEGRRVIAIAEKAGVTLMVAENYRFMPAVRLCKELVDQGALGRVRIIQLHEESPYLPGEWRKDRRLSGGGVFIDAGIHKVHFLRYLAGEPEHIYALVPTRTEEGLQGEDGLVFVAKWADGQVGLIHHSWTASNCPSPHSVSLSGSEGRIYFEIGEPQLLLEQGDHSQTFEIAGPLDGLLPMVQEFINSIREGRPPEVPGSEGLGDLAVVLKAYESVEKGMSLPLAATYSLT